MAAVDEGRSGAAERASGGGGRQAQFKPKHGKEVEAERRRAALKAQQNDARSSRISDFREIAMQALLGGVDSNDVEAEVEVEEDDGEDNVVAEGEIDVDTDMAGRRQNGNKMRRLRKLQRTLFFARQMQAPDWMIEVPADLQTNWMMMVRPEGDRCILFSDGGRVQIRRKNGYIQERYFDARLPKGLTILDVVCVEGPPDAEEMVVEASSSGAAADGSALEVEGADEEAGVDIEEDVEVVEEALASVDVDMGNGGRARGRAPGGGYTDSSGRGGRGGGRKGRGKGKGGASKRPHRDRKYAVCDVLFWDGTDMVGADTECRMFWLTSRFSELDHRTPRKARPLVALPAVDVTAEAVAEAYHEDVGYAKDSLQFMHRQAHYAIDTPVTPLSLMWRDRHISRFVVDTPDERGEKLPECQVVVLELRGNGFLRTAERRVVGQLAPDALDSLTQDKARAKLLVRCEISSVDMAAKTLLGVRPVAVVPARSRVWPDSWGRIVFQHLHRTGQTGTISFDVVAKAAAGV